MDKEEGEMREFTVKKGVMGYIVTIGCQEAGFSNKEDLITAVTDYIYDPQGMEKAHYSCKDYPTPPNPRPLRQGEPEPEAEERAR